MDLDLVVLGNLIVDDVVYEDGGTHMGQPGGATLYMGLAARLWNLRTGLVSIAGNDFPPDTLEALEDRGLDLAGIRRSGSPGLRTWLLYEGSKRRVIHRLEGATHSQASPGLEDIPSDWHPRAVHLAPMPFSLHRELITDLRSRFGDEVLLSLDPYELLTGESLDDWQTLLSRIDLFFVSEDEMPSGRIDRRPEAFLRRLFAGRLSAVLHKQGAAGGRALQAVETTPLTWPGLTMEVVDTTGAGDAFACGVLAGLIRDQPLARSLQWGVVSASFAIEGQGVEGLLQASPAAAQTRLESWFSV